MKINENWRNRPEKHEWFPEFTWIGTIKYWVWVMKRVNKSMTIAARHETDQVLRWICLEMPQNHKSAYSTTKREFRVAKWWNINALKTFFFSDGTSNFTFAIIVKNVIFYSKIKAAKDWLFEHFHPMVTNCSIRGTVKSKSMRYLSMWFRSELGITTWRKSGTGRGDNISDREYAYRNYL